MPSTRWVRTELLGPRARFSLARSYAALERLIFAAAIGADPQTKLANRRDTGESEHALGSRHRACSVRSRNHINAHHGVGAGVSCTSTPGPHRRAKDALASSILGAAARGERDPIRLYATALVVGPWEPAIGEGPASQPIRSIYGQRPESRSRGRRGRGFRGIASRGMNGCLNNFTKDAELEFCSRNDGYFCALNPRSDACPQRR